MVCYVCVEQQQDQEDVMNLVVEEVVLNVYDYEILVHKQVWKPNSIAW